MFHSTEQNTNFKLLIRIVLISTLKSCSHFLRLIFFSDISMFLTWASLSQTKNKRYSGSLFCCIIFFRTGVSLSLKYRPISSVYQTDWIWMKTNILLGLIRAHRSSVRSACKASKYFII